MKTKTNCLSVFLWIHLWPLWFFLSPAGLQAATLQIYAIDVEGGKSTLYVSPSGQSMLVDAGYAGNGGRDAGRILAAAKAAGISQIDYLVITHYHRDHVGGVPELAARIPIRHFIDHGKNFELIKDNASVYDAYVKARKKTNHIEVKAGDTIPLVGVRVDIVTASGMAIEKPLDAGGQPNPACKSYVPIDPDHGENSRSIGMVIQYGKFRVVDLGDLYWNQEHDLACPNNQLGTVDLYMTTHHGKKTSGSPQMVWALHPKVAIMNNGPSTGGSEQAWQTIHDSPGLLALWQLHYATKNDPKHNVDEQYIANLKETGCTGDWIRVVAEAGGSFKVTNGRTGFEKEYH
jgi:competence protein ComEC